MEQQKCHKPDMPALRFSNNPSSHYGSSKTSLALQTHRARSAAPSFHCSVSSAPAPKDLPGDPLGPETYLRGVGLRPGRTNRCLLPKETTVAITGNEQDEAGWGDTSAAVDVLEYLPLKVAKMIINMQQHYAAGLEELTGKLGGVNEALRAAREENGELKKRLDMHFGMLQQASKFLRSVRDGSFEGPNAVEEGDVEAGRMNMDVPPAMAADREPVRSTGRKATKRRGESGSCGLRRGGRRRTARKSAVRFEDGSDGMELDQTEETLREEENRQQGDQDEGEDNDHLKILAGAPRLQAILRKSAWTAINHRHSDTDPNADYRPPSPSYASSASDSSPPRTPSPSPSPATPPPSRTPKRKTRTRKTPKPSSSASPPSSDKRRYKTPRHTTIPRYACGPQDRPFHFLRMARTVLDVWTEYKHGTQGNHAIEFLERTYATDWRTGTVQQIKYGSNYVSVRLKVVSAVEDLCEKQGVSPEEACRRLDERVAGRMHMLIAAVRKKKDPFEVIPKK
ncbi:hypothetical protein V8C35DRAFT_328486 [Trichoderma chlorosporum]